MTSLVERADLSDDEAAAQAALALDLACMVEAGSVPAARELRLVLVDLRAARDPSLESDVTTAQRWAVISEWLSTATYRDDRPFPPGWRSTELDGDPLEYLGRSRAERDKAGDVAGVAEIDLWAGANGQVIAHLADGVCGGPHCSASGLHHGSWPPVDGHCRCHGEDAADTTPVGRQW